MGEDAIRELARTRLGFERLRPGQLHAVVAASSGRDVLAVLPTGGGKSAIYELAGLMRDGPTVVVSPLIALQDDQLAHLRKAGLSAIVLNSQQSAAARAAALDGFHDSDSFVFVSPEQLTNAQTREALHRSRPGLFVVDEAQEVLAAAGQRVTLYHAGLSARARHEAMTAFLDGSVRIVAATVAFGMGIDKPDVRWVLHADPPASLDAYYQELGRAGRDEKPARARLLFRVEDFGMARHLTSRSVGVNAVARVAERLSTGRELE